ncbi:MAG: ATPase, P-type (transporting), superfamily, subfamily [Oscillospiraceae bacterium]|nr:ATPase, P-type (transporting), superfamily, subfamily [Oscillospiraceae bacterium]
MMSPKQALWHTMDSAQTLDTLNTTAGGLSAEEAARRLEEYGPNHLEEGKKKSLLQIFGAQFKDFMIWVLVAAAGISAFLGEGVDAAIIGLVVMINAVMGTVQESKAEAALAALSKMAAPYAKVIRDEVTVKLPAAQLVPGDIVVLEAGDSIPADLRLLESNSLKIEESALTGESVPVEKSAGVTVQADAPLGDRINLAYLGTAVTSGRSVGVVVVSGINTEMGKIAHQLSTGGKEITPLQQKLNQLSNLLSYLVIAIAVIIFVIGKLGGRETMDMFLTAVSLAVAAIPEGMVAVVTIVLAMGMQRMAKQGAIIRRLPAVETLGSTDVVCSDKTGTLTLNRMTVTRTWTWDAPADRLFEVMLHCNDSQPGEGTALIGDPTETALLDYLIAEGTIELKDVKARIRSGEIPFDSDRKLSTVVIDLPDGKKRVLVKGAPDVLLSRCTHRVSGDGIAELESVGEAEAENEALAGQALRVLAFAYKDVDAVDTGDVEGTESGLIFSGLAGMIDPPRKEATQAIAVCRKAGILPVMITGDHKVTAAAIAQDLGILGDGRRVVTGAELEQMSDDQLFQEISDIAVYARVAPEHKSRIVAAWQKRGKIVSMTGDGVNDAPALKAADIGVGMGITGTDVSKGASDMVLTDDNFATIVIAVKEGRRIFDNIHKAVRFLLSSNAGEVVTLLAATLMGWTILKPVHILWINLVTDSLPALALGVEPAEDGVMERRPRGKNTPFFTGCEWGRIAVIGLVEAALTMTAFLLGTQYSQETGMSMAFMTLSLCQLFAALGFQSEHHSVFRMRAKEHPALWGGLGVSAFLQCIVIVIPQLRSLFGLGSIPPVMWLAVLGLCLLMLLATELQKWVENRNRKTL